MDFELSNRQKTDTRGSSGIRPGRNGAHWQGVRRKRANSRRSCRKRPPSWVLSVSLSRKSMEDLDWAGSKLRSSWRNSGGPSPALHRSSARPHLERKCFRSLAPKSRRRSFCRPLSRGIGSPVLPLRNPRPAVIRPPPPPVRSGWEMNMWSTEIRS